MNFIEKILQEFSRLGLSFEPGNFIRMLSYMGKGMLVIFIIIAIIILATVIINKLFTPKTKTDNKD